MRRLTIVILFSFALSNAGCKGTRAQARYSPERQHLQFAQAPAAPISAQTAARILPNENSSLSQMANTVQDDSWLPPAPSSREVNGDVPAQLPIDEEAVRRIEN